MNTMISIENAKQLIRQHLRPMPVHALPLAMAAGQVLAADVFARQDIPAFEQSSMDGYAFRFDDRNQPMIIHGEMQAGAREQFTLLPQYASRIFTGAPLPLGADTVVMQEKVELKDGKVIITGTPSIKGEHVRPKGAEAKAGQLAIAKGSRLTAAAIGFLAGIGETTAEVCRMPVVGIIATGDELQQPGEELLPGQVFESNSFALAAALERAQVSQINFYNAGDELEALKAVMQDALANNDMVLLTGGVSVGDYDFVLRAAAELGISQLFHKVKQKPGKPLYFGKKEDKVIFGLPGNPSSVLSCFYQYVLPALSILSGGSAVVLKTVNAVLTHEYSKPAGLTHFLKAHFDDGKVTPLNAQESFRMSSFAQANGMIELEEEQTGFAAGTTVRVHLFPE